MKKEKIDDVKTFERLDTTIKMDFSMCFGSSILDAILNTSITYTNCWEVFKVNILMFDM